MKLKVRHGFSLIELVIVVVIIGIIGAIAVPRMSRGAQGASESALRRNLSVLRNAIDYYQTEHGGLIPTDDSTLVDQLTLYTDAAGNTSATQTATHIYGPYLRAMPKLPVGRNKGSTGVRDGGNPGDGSEGWFYDKNTGDIVANTKDDQIDAAGVQFNQY